MRHGNQGNSGKVQIPVLDATPLAQHLCVFQTEREGESSEGVGAALCTVDRESQVRSKEMVYRTTNFWGMRPEFETDGAIDESRNADGNEGESSQVVGMMILYRKAEKLEADAILKILFMPNL